MAYNIDSLVTVQKSPIDSTGDMKFAQTTIEEGSDITFSLIGIATDKHDVLDSLEITAPGGVGDILYIVDKSGTLIDTLTADASGKWVIDSTSTYLDDLSSGDYSFRYETDGTTEDVTFSWTVKVHDDVSGASKTITDSQTVIVDAVADSSKVKADTVDNNDGDPTNYAAIVDGGSATITMTVAFIDNLNATEEHWIVLQQVDGYPLQSVMIGIVDCMANVVTKLGSDGNLYYAVNVNAISGLAQQSSYDVEFTVGTPSTSKDLSTDLLTGTITVETSIDSSGNREPDYSNNYDLNVDPVTVRIGVVETDPNAVTLTVTGAEEDAYTLVTITYPADLTTAHNESATITITDPGNGAFYTYDSGTDVYTPVTTLVEGETYYYKANDDWSGTTNNVKYTVTIRDIDSGAIKESDVKTSSVRVTAVADEPTDLYDYTAVAAQVIGTTSATTTAALKATFGDYTDGSESHYFILAVPVGVGISTSGYTLLSATAAENLVGSQAYDPDMNYYRTTVSNSYLTSVSGDANLAVDLTIGHEYAGGDVSYWAYASDTGGGVTDTAVSASATITLDVTGVTLNTDPIVASTGEEADVTGLVASGQVDPGALFTDPDGDSMQIGQVEGATTGDAGDDVAGTYGTLNIDQDGNYTYTVNTANTTGNVVTIAEGKEDTFTLYGDDGHGGTTASGVDLTFTYDANYQIGTSGNDTIHAGPGNDVLYGGTGSDTFVWTTSDLDGSMDKIMDFSLIEKDRLDLTELLGSKAATIDNLLDHVSITGSTDSTVTLEITNGTAVTTVEVTFQGSELQPYVDSSTGTVSATMEETLLTMMLLTS